MLEARSRNWCSSVDIVIWLRERSLGKHGLIPHRRSDTSLLSRVQNSSGAKCVPEGSLEGSKVEDHEADRYQGCGSIPPLPHTSAGRTGPTTRNVYAFVRGWLHYFCSRLITLLLFAVDYVTFVRGWSRYFCSRLITLLLFAADHVTFVYGWLRYVSG